MCPGQCWWCLHSHRSKGSVFPGFARKVPDQVRCLVTGKAFPSNPPTPSCDLLRFYKQNSQIWSELGWETSKSSRSVAGSGVGNSAPGIPPSVWINIEPTSDHTVAVRNIVLLEEDANAKASANRELGMLFASGRLLITVFLGNIHDWLRFSCWKTLSLLKWNVGSSERCCVLTFPSQRGGG